MDEKLSQNNPFPPILLRVGVIIVLLASGIGVLLSVIWIYRRVHGSLGLEIANVAVAFLVILILRLIIIGFKAGFRAKELLRQRRLLALRVFRLLKWSRVFLTFWECIGPQSTPETNSSSNIPIAFETTVVLDRSPKRGRPPTYSIDRWIKVVSAWENRDPWRNPITLNEFLSQEFGTCADGSPKISKKTFYDWQKKVRKEICKQQAMQKNSSG
jgi:hypothetical protein